MRRPPNQNPEKSALTPSDVPAYGHRHVWRIAAPLILSNISVPLLGAVDTAVLGHLDDPRFLGGLAVGTTIFGFLYMAMNFLRMGTTGMAAQAYGRSDPRAMREVLAQSLIVAAGLGLVLIATRTLIAPLALDLIGATPGVTEEARVYFDHRIWSAPATLANFVLVGWFIGMQNGRGPLLLLLTVNLTNIALDILFVPLLGFATGGVAIASVISEYTGLLVGLASARKMLALHPGAWQVEALREPGRYRRLFTINANLFIRTLALMTAFAFLTAQGARLGESVLAANAILINFQYLMAYALDGFANAAEALVGRATADATRARYRRAVTLSLQWSAAVALVFAGIYWVAGPAIIGLLTGIEDVRVTAHAYLPWIVLSPILSVWSFAFDGIFVGATRAREMRNTMILSLALFVAAWQLLRPLGNHGLWLSFMLFMSARGFSLAFIYKRLDARAAFI